MRGAQLWIGDGLIISCLEADEKLGIFRRLGNRVFRVADTPLTYRQVNVLDADGLIGDHQRQTRTWRKFSFREMVYLQLVSELKKFGMTHNKLEVLREGFFGRLAGGGPVEGNSAAGVGDIAITCVFLRVEILISVDADGEVIFWDPANYARFSARSLSHVSLVLNPFVNRVVETMHKDPVPATSSLRSLLADIATQNTNKKEERLLEIVRDQQYDSIRVKKKDGQISTVYAERNNRENVITEEDLMKLVRGRDFQDVKIVKRDGKIVSFKVEDTYKV